MPISSATYNQQVTKLLSPQASTQLLLIKHKHTCSSLSRTNQHICTLHEHGHGLNIIKPTTVLTLGCICDLCCEVSPLLCPTLWHYGLYPPGFSVHGMLQARMLEWVAVPSSRGSSQLRDRTHVPCVSCITSGFFTSWATRESHIFDLMCIEAKLHTWH